MLRGVNLTFRFSVSVSSSRVEMSLQMGPTRYPEASETDYSLQCAASHMIEDVNNAAANAIVPYALSVSFCHFQKAYFMKIKFKVVRAFWGCFMFYCRYFVSFLLPRRRLVLVTVPSVTVDRAYPAIYGKLQVS